MKVQLIDLTNQSLQQIKSFFANIPNTETELEISGDFDGGVSLFYTLYSDVANALSYLPKHITTVKFSGEYAMHDATFEEYSGHDVYTKTHYKNIHIGNALPLFIAGLPDTVSKASFAFKCTNIPKGLIVYSIDELINTVSSVQSNITSLDLSGMSFDGVTKDKIIRLFSNITQTIEALNLNCSTTLLIDILQVLPSTIIRLGLRGIDLGGQNETYFINFLSVLSPDLEALDLGNCNLNKLSPEVFHTLTSNLPPKLIQLGLSNNNLFAMKITPKKFANSLRAITPSVVEVDLGENYFLSIKSNPLGIILNGFQKTVKRLRLSQSATPPVQGASPMDGRQMAIQLSKIPPHIDTVIFSRMNFFDLSASEFSIGLKGLPPTVHTLDFSELTWNSRPFEDLSCIFSNVPPEIFAIKLCGNRLLSTNPEAFKKWLHAFAPQIREVDFSGNGFDRLLPSQFNRFSTGIPGRILRIILDKNQFALQNNGALVAYPATRHHQGLFKPQGVILHHKQVADFKLVMMQFLKSSHLSFKTVALIFSYALASTEQENNQMEQQLALGLVSEKRPARVTQLMKQESINTALARIHLASMTQASKTDLSRCGLNRLDNLKSIETLFLKISDKNTELSLRANGFGQTVETRAFIIQVLGLIPRKITYLDLSDNGFEYYNAEQLSDLFSRLPPTVKWVSLGPEKPLSPADHIALRQYPESYDALMTNCTDIMQQVRAILDDYTKGDSAFWRAIFFHWNRHHTEEVAQIVTRIDEGLITNISDVLSELNLIDKSNDIGSLAKRISFMTKTSLAPRDDEHYEGMEMTTLTSNISGYLM
ncbi:DUF5617 domain-containing protein [Legionella fallonii]|uniref:RavJ-like C-terminal domain-containing protein n=1 Tax=Legionella fallonii LLAP-10 TaxID=1212491 RepID=A0A098G0F2_9GAMM|nr:DUF5617 domain-containing protein [Legionella fallonii]CEG55987.1 protein of unknown function [Leucine-rich repeat] [Legionella fallonii LLAP-10]